MENRFTCIMLDGRGVTDEARRALVRGAIWLKDRRRSRVKMTWEGYEGVVYATEKYAVLGDTGGLMFRAVIECEDGTTKVEYIISGMSSYDEELEATTPWFRSPQYDGLTFEEIDTYPVN